jgi:isopentenyl-diphosphate Delta-isomerase
VTVELVTPEGEPAGACPVRQAHEPPGRLHRAFSVVLFDEDRRTLIQRRAATKSRFALLWSNTCCSHPPPGSSLIDFAVARVGEELRMQIPALREAGRFTYRAADRTAGWVEHEYDHVLVSTGPAADPDPEPSEVDSWRWVDLERLGAEMAANPAAFTPWFGRALEIAVAAL